MNDIGWGLLLNLLFWIVVVSGLVFACVFAGVEFFVGVAQRVTKTLRAGKGRSTSSKPSRVQEEAGDRYRKAS